MPSVRPANRWNVLLLILGLAAVAAAAVPSLRLGLLRAAGHALVAADPLPPSDIIVIAKDSEGAGVLEAADLVHAGVATRVALFPDPPDTIDREFIRRGVTYYDATAVSATQLKALGIRSVQLIPYPVTGTEDEGAVLQRWCAESGIRAIVFISTSDHSRRTRRVLGRSLHDAGITVTVRYTRYSNVDPDNWWRSRSGVRTEITESQKLLLDVLRHPFS